MPERPRLLFVYLRESSFVEEDARLLSEVYDVRPFHFRSIATGADALRQFGRQVRWLRRELPAADVVFGWFADYHMALPVVFARWWNVPVAVALGGFDCNWFPELGYGVFESRWRAPLARLVHRRASCLLPVSETLLRNEGRYATWPERRANGLLVHVPGLETPCEVIPTGYDPAVWPVGPGQRPPTVRTVALVDSDRTLRVKGIDIFFETAHHLPEVAFEVVGVAPDVVGRIQASYRPPPNVALRPPVARSALAEIYGSTSVYAQLSRTEGMPNVLCEAMLCGCIPVASAVAGNVEAVGEAGFLVETPRAEEVAQRLREALEAGAAARQRARAHIAERFGLAQRRAKLLRVLETLRAARSG